MKIFVAGATGAIGRVLLPILAERGHQVFGTTRKQQQADAVWALGAEPVVVDALDRTALVEAVGKVAPEVIVHQLTALSGPPDMKNFDRYFAATNALRTEGTDNLLAAARSIGARRFVAQSYTSWPYERTGGPVKVEDDPLDSRPAADARESLAAIRHVEHAVTSADDLSGIVLRYGAFYGPGNAVGRDGELLAMVAKRKLPVIGGGNGVWSFVHIHDAAAATVLAVEGDQRGVYNIVDDEPAPVRVWLPYLAEAVGAKPPMRLPSWMARFMLGEQVLSTMTVTRGASNAKAKRELTFVPRYASWRDGFRTGLG
jgi:2-alkyl-3-oxoalkanoate reductase